MSVKIQYLNKDLIENVDKDMFTKQLKENVSKKLNLDPKDVELKIGQIFLQDEKYIRKVLETNFILIYDNESIYIKINDITFVMEVTRSAGRSVEIKDLTGEITIRELKQKLFIQFKFDMKDIILKCENENIMEDEKYLKDYIDVKTLEIVVKNKTKTQLNITHNGETFYLNAFKEMTGKELQNEINKKIQLDIEKYILEFNGKRIELENTLNFDKIIVDEDMIVVKDKTKIKLNIIYNGEAFSLNAFKEMTGEELQNEINKKIQMTSGNFTLKINGEKIEPGDTLNNHNISDDDAIVVKNKTRVRIIIKQGDRIFSVNAFKEMTGEELQKKINKIFQTRNENFNLDYNAKIIESCDTLYDHEIGENSVIIAVPKVDGGE